MYREIYIIKLKEVQAQLGLQNKMSKFEKLLKEAKTKKEILNMQSCSTDNLTEDECISLKAKHLGISEKAVRFHIERSNEIKRLKWKKPLEEGKKTLLMIAVS